jgi:hypothetical protein
LRGRTDLGTLFCIDGFSCVEDVIVFCVSASHDGSKFDTRPCIWIEQGTLNNEWSSDRSTLLASVNRSVMTHDICDALIGATPPLQHPTPTARVAVTEATTTAIRRYAPQCAADDSFHKMKTITYIRLCDLGREGLGDLRGL